MRVFSSCPCYQYTHAHVRYELFVRVQIVSHVIPDKKNRVDSKKVL